MGFATAAEAIRKSVDAARDAEVTQRQLARQLQTSGASFAVWRDQIDKADLKLSHLSGFTVDELEKSLTTLDRATGNINTALKLNAVAADAARGSHKDLATIALELGKAYDGSTTSLTRLIGKLPQGVTGLQAIAIVAQRFAGQAKAGATAQDRFNAELHNSEVIIGEAILPTLNKYLTKGSDWLDQMNRSGRLQRDVNVVVKDFAKAIELASDALRTFKILVADVDKLTGGFKQTLELLIGLKVGSKLLGWGSDIGVLGSRASAAAGEVATLRGRLANLISLGAITVTVDVLERFIPTTVKTKGQKILSQGGGGALGQVPIIGPVAQVGALAGRDTRNFISGLFSGGSGSSSSLVPAQYADDPTLAEAYLEGYRNQTPSVSFANPQALSAYLAGRKAGGKPVVASKASGSKSAPNRSPGRGVPSLTSAKFALPFAIQKQLASALTPSQDEAAAQSALNFVQSQIDSGKLADTALLGALKERRKLYDQIARDVKKLTPKKKKATRRSGASFFSLTEQETLSRAEANAAGGSLAALVAYEQTLANALVILSKIKTTGAERLRQVREETSLVKTTDSIGRRIKSIEDRAQKKRDEAAKKRLKALDTYATPIRLQLAEARATALGQDLTPILVQMRTAAEKALKSGKLAIQGQIDAWNEIANINQQLGKSVDATPFKHLSSAKIEAALGLKGIAARVIIAQLGANNTLPPVSSAAYAKSGTTINIEHFHSSAPNIRALEDELLKRNRSRPERRRGIW